MSRRVCDAYYTPKAAVHQLLANLEFPLGGTCLECCSGEGVIARVLREAGLAVITNDIDPSQPADYHLDATQSESWHQLPQADWIITNPPYNQAPLIIPLAYEHARKGIIMLLRISWLEPCNNRAGWLADHLPSKIISIPRISFTGDRRTDSASTPWYCWLKDEALKRQVKKPIVIVPKAA